LERVDVNSQADFGLSKCLKTRHFVKVNSAGRCYGRPCTFGWSTVGISPGMARFCMIAAWQETGGVYIRNQQE
jgi:hypothetical protein